MPVVKLKKNKTLKHKIEIKEVYDKIVVVKL